MGKVDKLKLYKELLEFCNISGISYNGNDYMVHTSIGVFKYVDSENFKKDYSDNLSMFNKNKQKKSLTYHKVVKALEMLSKRYDVYLYSFINDMNNDYHKADTIIFNLFLESESESEFYQKINDYYLELLGKPVYFKLSDNNLNIAKIIKKIQEYLRNDFIESLIDRDWYGFMKTTCNQLALNIPLDEPPYTYTECVDYLEKLKIKYS